MPRIDIIAHCLKPGDCALSMTESTTSEGWHRKTNFSKLGDDPTQATVRLEAARMHARNYMALGFWDHSQWFPGKDNIIANALYQDDKLSDKELTLFFCTHCPSQIPNHFDILPLPNKIISWLTALLLRLPEKQQLFKKHKRTKLGCGTDG
jgi:hypothetical protein